MIHTLHEALQSEPTPLSPMEEFTLSWEAASERLLDAAALPAGTRRTKHNPTSTASYYLHYSFGVQPVFDVFRTVTGAEPKVPSKTQPVIHHALFSSSSSPPLAACNLPCDLAGAVEDAPLQQRARATPRRPTGRPKADGE